MKEVNICVDDLKKIIEKDADPEKKKLYRLFLPAISNWLETNVQKGQLSSFFRINLHRLAKEWQTSIHEIRDYFLYLVHDGFFILNWEFHCPHCNAVPEFKHNFSELHGEGFCPLCDVKFRNVLDNNIEVTFTIHPKYIRIPEEIEESYKNQMYEKAKQKQYRIEKPFFTGLECIHSLVFHKLFGKQVLAIEESLSIQNVVLLFTDIKGSTDMYKKFGDTTSFRIIKEHFRLLFSIIEKNHGYVIKTLGDAVMASFIYTEDALQASFEIFQSFSEKTWEPAGNLEIKVGLHKGPAIVVTFNERIDYFGNTVNVAYIIQEQLNTHSIGFIDTFFHDANIRTQLKTLIKENPDGKYPIKIFKRKVKLRGIKEEVNLYYLKYASN